MRDFLLVEATTYHGQVLVPLLESMDRGGYDWQLLLNEQHRDRETISGRPGWVARIEWLPDRPWAGAMRMAFRIFRDRFRCGVVLSPTRSGVGYFVLMTLLHPRPALLVHRLLEFPAPRAPHVGPLGAVFLSLFWRLCSTRLRILTLAPRLARRLASSWHGQVDSLAPVASALVSWQGLGRERLRLFLPGPLDSRGKKLEELFEALPLLGAREVPVTFVVAGGDLPHSSTEASLPTLREDPMFEWHIAPWLSQQRFLQIATGCHAALQVPSRGPEEDTVVTSVALLAEGLPRPLVHPAGAGATWPGLEYEDGAELAARIEKLWRQLQEGEWHCLMPDLQERRRALELYHDQVLRALVGGESTLGFPDPRGSEN